MPKKTVQSFSVEWLQILDENGNCDEALRPTLSHQDIKKLYEWMVLARVFDEKAFKLQREGRLGTYASILGQEAAQVGSAFALRPDDWMFPSFREPGASIVRGLPMRMILQYWAGDERGSLIPEELNDFPITIPVGTQPLGVAVTPDGSKVYVANTISGTVSVISTATNSVTDTIPVGTVPTAFGMFIQPAPRFAGAPGRANCYGRSVSALVLQDGGLNAAAAALGFASMGALQNAILAFCGG